MGAQSDQPAGNQPSLMKRLTGHGKHTGSDGKDAAAPDSSIGSDTEPAPRPGNDDDKVVFYSSNLFSASFMVDATRHGLDEPAQDEDDDAQR